jgi:hypothetical protein
MYLRKLSQAYQLNLKTYQKARLFLCLIYGYQLKPGQLGRGRSQESGAVPPPVRTTDGTQAHRRSQSRDAKFEGLSSEVSSEVYTPRRVSTGVRIDEGWLNSQFRIQSHLKCPALS